MNTNPQTIGMLPPSSSAAMAALSKLANEANVSSPTSPEAFNPPAISPLGEALTPDEIQSLKELVVIRSRQKATEYILPDKPVSEDDKTRFAESIFNRKAYSEKMIPIPGKLEVVFRCKTRREREFVDQQIEKDFADGIIKTERQYAVVLNNYNLMMQMVSQNGASVNPPASRIIAPGFSLRAFIDQHIINTLPEPMMFILSGALAQFENRVAFMSREVLDKNFSQPADDF